MVKWISFERKRNQLMEYDFDDFDSVLWFYRMTKCQVELFDMSVATLSYETMENVILFFYLLESRWLDTFSHENKIDSISKSSKICFKTVQVYVLLLFSNFNFYVHSRLAVDEISLTVHFIQLQIWFNRWYSQFTLSCNITFI